MALKRELTASLSYWLDALTPPIIRDSPLFAALFMDPWLGGRAKVFHRFFEDMPILSPEEIAERYREAGDVLGRGTDLNQKCWTRIVDGVADCDVLDAGCGKGLLARALAANNRVTCFDIAPAIEPADDGIRVVTGELEALPFTDKSFDVSVCVHTLEHVVDLQACITELRRVTRKRLIIVVPLQRASPFTPDLHTRFFPYPELFLLEMRPRKGSYKAEILDHDLFYEELLEHD